MTRSRRKPLNRSPVPVLVVGMGNPIRFDDGVGIEVARRLKREVRADEAEVVETTEAGLALLPLFAGKSRVIIVDAIRTEGGAPGAIRQFRPEDLPATQRVWSAHGVGVPGLAQVMDVLTAGGICDIVIYTIEVHRCDEFGEGLSPLVSEAVPRAVALIKKAIKKER